MSPAGIWAVLPIKNFSNAKRRLAPACGPALRAALARAMVEDVLSALAQSRRLAGCLVVTADPDAMALARRLGARVSSEAANEGQTAAIRGAARLLTAEGHAGMLTMPGDIPGMTAYEIDTVISVHGPAPSFTIVPAHDRRGSNAIVVSGPAAVPLTFGNDSFMPHLVAARVRGIEPRILELPGIALDIDNPADLTAFRATGWSGAARGCPQAVPTVEPIEVTQ